MTVVAGVDEAPLSIDVVTRGIEQALWRETDLHVVHVSHYPQVYTDVAIDWGEVMEAQRKALWKSLDDVLDAPDVHVERVDLEGYPPDTLVDYANEVGASLLVLGTRGRGEIASLVMGSTSHRAIHIARCDVLVVKNVDTTD